MPCYSRGALSRIPCAPLLTDEAREALGFPEKGSKKKQHLAALHYRDVPQFVVHLKERSAYLASSQQSLTAVLAVLFALLTASRTSEVLQMEWSEVSMDELVWIVPARRMKMNEEHFVPLSDEAMAILKAMKAKNIDSKYVFPSPRNLGEAMSRMAMLMVLRRVETGEKDGDGEAVHYGARTTMHGLARATSSTWAREQTQYKVDVIEVSLAHSEQDRVAAAYNRREGGSFAEERRKLLREWGAFVMSAADNERIGGNSRRRNGKAKSK